jgi:hypothetical protein
VLGLVRAAPLGGGASGAQSTGAFSRLLPADPSTPAGRSLTWTLISIAPDMYGGADGLSNPLSSSAAESPQPATAAPLAGLEPRGSRGRERRVTSAHLNKSPLSAASPTVFSTAQTGQELKDARGRQLQKTCPVSSGTKVSRARALLCRPLSKRNKDVCAVLPQFFPCRAGSQSCTPGRTAFRELRNGKRATGDRASKCLIPHPSTSSSRRRPQSPAFGAPGDGIQLIRAAAGTRRRSAGESWLICF